MAKLSKANIAIIEKLQESIMENAKMVARMKGGCENIPEWFSEKPVAYYEGLQAAHEGALSMILMDHNAYRGFQEVTCEVLGFTATYNHYYHSSK